MAYNVNLNETFAGSSLPSTLVAGSMELAANPAPGATLTVGNGIATVAIPANNTSALIGHGLRTAQPYPLNSARFVIRVDKIAVSSGSAYAQTRLTLYSANGDRYVFFVGSVNGVNELTAAVQNAGGVIATSPTVRYDPNQHKWFCIDTSQSGSVLFQTSPDGTTWSTFYAYAGARMNLSSGYGEAVALSLPGAPAVSAAFDDFLIETGTPDVTPGAVSFETTGGFIFADNGTRLTVPAGGVNTFTARTVALAKSFKVGVKSNLGNLPNFGNDNLVVRFNDGAREYRVVIFPGMEQQMRAYIGGAQMPDSEIPFANADEAGIERDGAKVYATKNGVRVVAFNQDTIAGAPVKIEFSLYQDPSQHAAGRGFNSITLAEWSLSASPAKRAVRLAFNPPPATPTQIFRSTVPGGYDLDAAPLATVPANATEHVDSTAALGTRYYYTSRAVLGGGSYGATERETSAMAHDLAAGETPPPATDISRLRAVQGHQNLIVVWSPALDAEPIKRKASDFHYQVYRCASANTMTGATLLGRGEQPGYIFVPPTQGQTYHFAVVAIDRKRGAERAPQYCSAAAPPVRALPVPPDPIKFVIGDLIPCGDPRNPFPWFDAVEIERGIQHGETIPQPGAPGTGDYLYPNSSDNRYYDLPLCHLITYYRTGDERWLNYFQRSVAYDRTSPRLDRNSTEYGALTPRSSRMVGWVCAAILIDPALWQFVTDYMDGYGHHAAMWDMWIGGRLQRNEQEIFDVRDCAYIAQFACLLAALHPDAGVRATWAARADQACKSYFGDRQAPDGHWRAVNYRNSYNLHRWGQPFQHALVGEALVWHHKRTGDPVVKDMLDRLCYYLYERCYYPERPWRTAAYFSHTYGYWTYTPFDGKGRGYQVKHGQLPVRFSDDGSVDYDRAQLQTFPVSFGYLFRLTGDARYRRQCDEIMDSAHSRRDGYASMTESGNTRHYGEGYRNARPYLADRLTSAQPPPAPPAVALAPVTGAFSVGDTIGFEVAITGGTQVSRVEILYSWGKTVRRAGYADAPSGDGKWRVSHQNAPHGTRDYWARVISAGPTAESARRSVTVAGGDGRYPYTIVAPDRALLRPGVPFAISYVVRDQFDQVMPNSSVPVRFISHDSAFAVTAQGVVTCNAERQHPGTQDLGGQIEILWDSGDNNYGNCAVGWFAARCTADQSVQTYREYVNVDAPELVLAPGATRQLAFTSVNNNAEVGTDIPAWTGSFSTDETVATVSPQGLVTTYAPGEAWLTLNRTESGQIYPAIQSQQIHVVVSGDAPAEQPALAEVVLTVAPPARTTAGQFALSATARDQFGAQIACDSITIKRGSATKAASTNSATASGSDAVTAADNGTITYAAYATKGGATVVGQAQSSVQIPVTPSPPPPPPPPDTAAPTVTITATPAPVTQPGTLTLTASATDNVGVAMVRFYEATVGGDVLLASDAAAPYSCAVEITSANANGTHVYKAVATDGANNAMTATTSVVVNIPTTPDPPSSVDLTEVLDALATLSAEVQALNAGVTTLPATVRDGLAGDVVAGVLGTADNLLFNLPGRTLLRLIMRLMMDQVVAERFETYNRFTVTDLDGDQVTRVIVQVDNLGGRTVSIEEGD